MNEDSTILETLSGNYGTFGISTTGNSLFVKFEINTWGCSSWCGFFAKIDYGTPKLRYSEFRDIVNIRGLTRSFIILKFGCTYNNIYFCFVYDLNFLKQIPTCFMLVTKHKYI